jgi:membrane protein
MANPSLAKLRKLHEHTQALLEGRHFPFSEDANLSPTKSILLFCARVYHSFVRNRCPTRAAALAYTNLLALVPLLAVVVSVSASMIKSQGEQSIQEWIREAITKAAPILGLKEAGDGSSVQFTPIDIKDRDLDRIVGRLQNNSGPLSRYLWDSRFSGLSKSVLTNQTLPIQQRKEALVAEFNKVVANGALYEPERFSKVHLSTKTAKLNEQNPQGQDLVRLNHWLLMDAFPIGEDALETVTSQITSFVSNFQSGKLGVSAVLALIFVAISLLSTVESTLNDIWGVTRGRGWFARVVQYWAALTLGPMFFLSAVTLTTWSKLSKDLVEQLPLVHVLLPFVVPFVILSFGCALLYLVMPNTKVPWLAALLGGLVAGSLLQLNSYFNVFYVSRVLTYRQIYGSMAALPLFLLGLYFSWLLVLFGAQVAYAFQNRRTYAQERQAEIVNHRGREFAAFRLMAFIGQRFQAGERPPTAAEMAEDLRIPLRLVGQIMTLLLQTGLVLEVNGSEMAYAPGRPLDRISMRDILQALRTGQGQDLATCEDSTRPVITKEFETIELAWQKAADALTLFELVQHLPPPSGPCAQKA